LGWNTPGEVSTVNHDPPRKAPEEFNIVLERPQMSDEQRARSIARLLLKESMRRSPKAQRTLTLSFGDQPDFFIVVELWKDKQC
jgi:hypothetical protein